MRVALVLVFVASAWSAQAAKTKRDPADYLKYFSERALVRELLGSPGADDVPPETTPKSAALVEKFARLSGERDLETANCSYVLAEELLETLRDEPRDSDDFRYFKFLARSKLEECAKEFDEKFKDSAEYMLEWSLDKFFGKVAATDKKITDEVLFEAAASFDIQPEVFHNEQLCQVAAAFNKLRDREMFDWLRRIANGILGFSWYSRPQLDRMLDQALEETEAANCRAEVYWFFTKTCEADHSGLEFDLRQVNYAAAFGADLSHIVGFRAAKNREYRRICYSQLYQKPSMGSLGASTRMTTHLKPTANHAQTGTAFE